jgi:hypothetical protein
MFQLGKALKVAIPMYPFDIDGFSQDLQRFIARWKIRIPDGQVNQILSRTFLKVG